MKMKEVLLQTRLTDRAVRLYIENGLLTPNNEKSYSGRNSYDFTEEDVAILQQIALLRKAEFSLEQIKILQQGGEGARTVFLQYLQDKQASVIQGQKILSALEPLADREQVTIDQICNEIEKGLCSKPVPKEDLKPGKGELFEKWIMRIICIPLLYFFSMVFIGVMLDYSERFPRAQIYWNPINHIGMFCLLFPITVWIFILVRYRKPILNPKKRNKRLGWSVVLLILSIYIAVNPAGLGAINFMPPVYSQTHNPEDYMVIGTYVQDFGDSIRRLFPATIPNSAIAEDAHGWYPPDKFPETTKYYYYFQDMFDPSFDLCAEWVLPTDEYEAEKERVAYYFPEGAAEEVRWGDWTCLNFGEDPMARASELGYYYYLIFAYNDRTQTVRYIAAYAMDQYTPPHFVSLPW